MAHLKQIFNCVCGDKHESVGRLGGFPILLCPAAPSNALYFFPDKLFLTTGNPPAAAKKEGKK